MFSEAEIEALVLGSRWVAGRADRPMATFARAALSKIAAVLPEELAEELENSTLLIGPGKVVELPHVDPATIRTGLQLTRVCASIESFRPRTLSDWIPDQVRYDCRVGCMISNL